MVYCRRVIIGLNPRNALEKILIHTMNARCFFEAKSVHDQGAKEKEKKNRLYQQSTSL
jgi:hypothetical protein